MRRYARRIEDCRHAPVWRWLAKLGIDPSHHGWRGWMRTEKAVPFTALGDVEVRRLVEGTARRFVASLARPLASIATWLRGAGDPNARPWTRRSFEGLCYTPMTTSNHRRIGTRERLLDVAARHPGRLHIEYDALATRVLLDDRNVRVTASRIARAVTCTARIRCRTTTTARRARSVRHARSCCAAARSTRRSC